ncbi:MAG: SWIM zinc finger family protein [Patescibacteria group bacterium]
MIPQYDLDKIKYGTDEATFKKAVDLYENGKVTEFEESFGSFSAVVIGGNPYHVVVSESHYDRGSCDCYLGQQDVLCKHMVALALYVVLRGKRLTDEQKQQRFEIKCSGHLGKLDKNQLIKVKSLISEAARYIKPYNGPSKIWFAYQASLTEGCNRLAVIVSDLPVSLQTTELVIKLLLRLDKKLSFGGVDDSDGTVGGFIEEVVAMLIEYVKLDSSCRKAFEILKDQETCFGWEKPLLGL